MMGRPMMPSRSMIRRGRLGRLLFATSSLVLAAAPALAQHGSAEPTPPASGAPRATSPAPATVAPAAPGTPSPEGVAPAATFPRAAGSASEAPTPVPEGSTGPAAPDEGIEAAVAAALEEGAVDLDIVARIVPESELDRALAERASGSAATPAGVKGPWLIGFRLSPQAGLQRLEVTAIPPDSSVRRVSVDVLEESRLELRAMVLLREVVRLEPSAPVPTAPEARESAAPPSSGRAGLALNGALLGGYIGVSLQQASDSEDDRLLYPLAALGVGLGLGASMLVADEWNITTEDAWYISAGMLWPAASGSLIAASYDVAPEHRYLYGLSGAAAGITLSSIAVARGGVHTGSAAIAHSGGAFGMGLGALTQGVVEGNLEDAPLRGMGYGTGLGVLAAGIVATRVETSPSRVLLVDLAALLGGLTGGAVATPLLLTDDVPDSRRRLWFGAVGLGTVAGAALGLLATEGYGESASGIQALENVHPYAGVIGTSVRGSEQAPVYGGGLAGAF